MLLQAALANRPLSDDVVRPAAMFMEGGSASSATRRRPNLGLGEEACAGEGGGEVEEAPPAPPTPVAAMPSPIGAFDMSPPASLGTVADHDGEDDREGADERGATGWALLHAAMGVFGRERPRVSASTAEDGARGSQASYPSSSMGSGGYSSRAFDIADSMESGYAKETSTDFMTPLRRSRQLWRFRVNRSDDKAQARLMTDGGEFLMYARVVLEARCIQFFLYDPARPEDSGLFDGNSPAFTMSFNSARTEWRLVQERCDNCQFAPPYLSCARHGKQQVAFIRHARSAVGDGVSNTMEVCIPGLYTDGSAVVWCPALGRGDLAAAAALFAGGGERCHETQHLITRQPVWNEEVESLVLDFKGRNVTSSAKNFQLALAQKPTHIICQYGKLANSSFGLDFKFPLNVVQAFAVAMTTIFWT
jgi:hypothetical protein